MAGTVSAGEVSLKVSADTTGVGSKIKNDVDKEVGGADFGSIGKKLGGMILSGVAILGVFDFFKTGFDEAMDASAGIAQLQAGIESTGNAANVTVQGMTDLASAIQGYSGQTDDSIVKTEQLLLTFTNIKNSGPDKIFDQATTAAADMAAKLGGDASASAIQLGKALNDPTQGITALTRVGVSFTDAQKQQIQAMQESGDMAGAQKEILKELNKEFGGAAKAAGESLPGQLNILKRHFEDTAQGIAEQMTPVIQKILPALGSALDRVKDIFKGLGDVIKWSVDNMNIVAPVAVGLVAAFTGFFIIGTIIPMVTGLAAALGILEVATISETAAKWAENFAWLASPITWIVLAIAAVVAAVVLLWMNWDTVVKWISDVWNGFVGWLTDGLNAVAKWWNDLWAGVFKVVQDIWNNIVTFVNDLVTGFLNWFQQNWLMILGFITGPFGLAIAWIISNWDGIVQFFSTTLSNIGNFFSDAFNAVGDTVRTVFGGIADFINGVFSGVTGFFKGVVNGFIDFMNHAMDIINPLIDGPVGDAARSIGLNIHHLSHIPHLADGGVVMPKPGGQIVKVAEAGQAEAVIPLSKLEQMTNGKGTTVNYYAAPNQSLSGQEALSQAMRRAKVLVGW